MEKPPTPTAKDKPVTTKQVTAQPPKEPPKEPPKKPPTGSGGGDDGGDDKGKKPDRKHPHLTEKQSAKIEKLEKQYRDKLSKAKNQRALTEILKSQDKVGTMIEYLKTAEDVAPPPGAIEVLEKIKSEKTPLKELNYEELKSLYEGALHYVHKKLTEDKLIQGEKWHKVQDATDSIVQDVIKIHKRKPYQESPHNAIEKLLSARDWLTVGQLLPEHIACMVHGKTITIDDIINNKELPALAKYGVHDINKGYDSLYRLIQTLQDEWLAEYERDPAMIKDSLALTPKAKDIKWQQFKLDSGKTIELAPDQVVEIYMHAHNPEDLYLLIGRTYGVFQEGKGKATRRFDTRKEAGQYIAEKGIKATIKEDAIGGIRVPLHNTPYAKRSAQDRTKVFTLTSNDLKNMFDKLTPGQKRRAKLMLTHYNGPLKEAGNQASLAVHGYEVFDVDKYGGPRNRTEYDRTSKQYKKDLNSAAGIQELFEAFQYASQDALGIAQKRTKETGPLFIGGAYRKYMRYVWEMGAYSSFLEPYYNLKQIYSNRGLKLKMDQYGMRRYIKALEGLMRDTMMFQRRSMDDFDLFLGNWVTRFQPAALGYNIWVSMKQPLSYTLAATELPPKYLAKPLATVSSKADVEEMSKYSMRQGYMRLKRGASSREMGEIGNIAMPMWFFAGKDSKGQKVTTLIKRGDSMAVIRLWKLIKNYVKDTRPDLKYNSEEFLQTVGRAYDWLVERTQPSSLPTSRGAITRSQNQLLRFMTFFMSFTNKVASGLVYNYHEFMNSARGKSDLAKALKKILFFVLAAGGAQLVDEARNMVKMRTWDRTWDKILVDVVGKVLGVFFPLNMLYASVVGKQRYGSHLKFYDVNNPLYGNINSIVDFGLEGAKAIDELISQDVYKSGLTEGQKKWPKTLFRATMYGLDALAPLTGWPFRNVRTLIMDAGRLMSPDMQFLIDHLGSAPNPTTQYKKYWGWLEQGNIKMAERQMSIMIDHMGRKKEYFERSFESYPELPPELIDEMRAMYDRLTQD